MKLLHRRIIDGKLLRLIGGFLRSGVMEQKLFQPTTSGVSQGSIVSPLLANLYLHELDKFMEKYSALTPYQRTRRRKQGKGNFLYARYADDCAPRRRGKEAEMAA
jgi:RNA-directed DNA polymerase